MLSTKSRSSEIFIILQTHFDILLLFCLFSYVYFLSLEHLPHFTADEFMLILQRTGEGQSLLAACPAILLHEAVMLLFMFFK